MKLPTRKRPPSGYLQQLRAEFEALSRQLSEAERAATAAQTEAEHKRRAYRELEERSQSTTWSTAEQRLYREKNQAEAEAARCREALYPLREEHARLERLVTAPGQLEETKAELKRLAARRAALGAELQKAAALRGKLEARIDELQRQLTDETRSAAQRLIDAGDLAPIPAELGTQQAELTATRHTLEEVARRIKALEAEREALPETIRRARDQWLGARATVAEIELREQLPAFIGLIAQAAVAAHRAGFSRERDRYAIEIPQEALEAAAAALDAELPAA